MENIKVDYSEAFSAIQDIATNMLSKELSPYVQENIELILSIARYRHDVRTESEKQNDI